MIRVSAVRRLSIVCAGIAAACSPPGLCLEQKKPEAGKPSESKPTDIQQFCVNNAANIGDARIAWQTSRLLALGEQIKARLAELEAKQAEYVAWLRKRDEALRQATESVAAIYARMRPEAAATQLAAMEESTAAAILVKLSSRNAGAILNEMEAGRAARLTRAMTGPEASPEGNSGRGKSPEGKKS